MMLLERRTFLYHVSGIFGSFLIWHFLGKPNRFPGSGIRLENPPSTRSWGYAHYTDTQFRRVVEADEEDQDISGTESRSLSPSVSRERSQRSGTPSPSLGPRPRCPPPP